jgi:hypothetical protein
VCESEQKDQLTCIGLWRVIRAAGKKALAPEMKIVLDFDRATSQWVAMFKPYYSNRSLSFDCGDLSGLRIND